MSDWTKEINYEIINESLRAIDEIDIQNPDLVKLISMSGLPADELAAEILRSPHSEQKALVSAISKDNRLCNQLRSEQKQWKQMKRTARFDFLVSLHDNIRCINLDLMDLHEWTMTKIKQAFELLGVRYIEIAQRASELLSLLQGKKEDTFLRTLKSMVEHAVRIPVPEIITKNIIQRSNIAVARGFYFSKKKGFEKAPSGEEVTNWIGNRGKIIFPLVASPYRRIFVAYVDVPKSKKYIEALWLNLAPDDHFFVVTNKLENVDKLVRIRHELRHFCQKAFTNNV